MPSIFFTDAGAALGSNFHRESVRIAESLGTPPPTPAASVSAMRLNSLLPKPPCATASPSVPRLVTFFSMTAPDPSVSVSTLSGWGLGPRVRRGKVPAKGVCIWAYFGEVGSQLLADGAAVFVAAASASKYDLSLNSRSAMTLLPSLWKRTGYCTSGPAGRLRSSCSSTSAAFSFKGPLAVSKLTTVRFMVQLPRNCSGNQTSGGP
mmetsp:Transcript_23914/g.75331  ORF Transcript_23914/g.75331 Transcript_23914/m.75331 type:complete len:206 (-) Transcript_23914:297-914(-)